MDAVTCGGCRFFRNFYDGRKGLCKRRAAAVPFARVEADAWPTVLPGWGACGEFERRGQGAPAMGGDER